MELRKDKTEKYIDTVSGEILIRELYHHENRNIRREYFSLNADIHIWHREDGPAIKSYYESGKKERESYYQNNEFHNKFGPAVINYNRDGSIKGEWYYLNGIECDILQEMVIRGLEKERLSIDKLTL